MNTSKCSNCGAPLDVDATFCEICGTNAPPVKQDNVFATVVDVGQQHSVGQRQAGTSSDGHFNAPEKPYDAQVEIESPYIQFQNQEQVFSDQQLSSGQAPQYGQASEQQQTLHTQAQAYSDHNVKKTADKNCVLSLVVAVSSSFLMSSTPIFICLVIYAFSMGVRGVKTHNPSTHKFRWMGVLGIVISVLALLLFLFG